MPTGGGAGPRGGALLERERELAVLARMLAGARVGVGTAVVVEGPPGIGKSRLLAAARAAADDVCVVSARGSELERAFAFGVVRQLFEPVLVGADAEQRRALLAGAAAEAAPVLGSPDAEQRDEPPQIALHGLYWFAANLAARRPLLLVIDDVQWADGASLRFLAYLLKRLDALPLALVLATRPAAGDESQVLLDEVLADPVVEVLHPAPLSVDAVFALTDELLERRPDAGFAAACHRASGGNPFLLRELLHEVAERGVEPIADNGRRLLRLSARGVNRAVLARLRRLPRGCAALARAVAVLGDGELATAAALAGLDATCAADAADALIDGGILEPGRSPAFAHPLVRAAVHSQLRAAQRAVWHARAVALLRGTGAPAERLAAHLLECQPGADPGAVQTLRAAAADARRRGAVEEAVTYLSRALREPAVGELTGQLRLELGAAELHAGDIEPAIAHLTEAIERLPDHQAAAVAAGELGVAVALSDRPEHAVTALNAAIVAIPEDAEELHLRLHAVRHIAGTCGLAARRRIPVVALEPPPGRPQSTGERLRLAVLASEAVDRDPAACARDLALRALDGGKLLDDPNVGSPAAFMAPIALIFADELDEATRALDAALARAERHGSVMTISVASHLRAFASWRRGALREVEADAANALDGISPGGLRPGVIALVEARLARADLHGATELARAAGLESARGDARGMVVVLQTRARLRAAQGRPDEALADLLECGRLEDAWDVRTPARSNWRADAAPLLAARDDKAAARRLLREELARCRAFGAPRPLGTALRAAGALEQGVRGLALLDEAVQTLAGSPARLEHALAVFEFGAALRRAGRRPDARRHLGHAVELATRCHADALRVRAHDELVAAGARPRRDPIESRSRLTASELRVARRAAEGMSNRAIAQALFLTEKTIEMHLSRAYGKLGISSRTQLARALGASPSNTAAAA